MRFLKIMVAVIGLLAMPIQAQATHAWDGYHWPRSSNPFLVTLVDQTSYDADLAAASADWSLSPVLDTTIAASCPTGGRCGTVMNAAYGQNGWLGLATIWVDSVGHIQRGQVQLNDSYLKFDRKYSDPKWSDFVMCQEVGHIFGLAHQDENSSRKSKNLGTCMDYTSNPARDDGAGTNLQPNAHDYEELGIIYTSHLDSGATKPAGSAVTFTIPADRFACSIDEPISAAALNAGGTWTFEAFNGTPDGFYLAKVQWAGDPSNGGHPNTSLSTDATGHGATTLPAHWAPDGFLPGTFDAAGNYTAVPGDFSIHLYAGATGTKGTANCAGTVGP